MRTLGFVLDDSPFLASFFNKTHNKTDRIWTFNNGSIMEFKSFDDEQDAKGGRRDYLFMNEANGISYKIYDQLQVRTSKQVFIDYNPTCPFWVHKKLLKGRSDVQLIISNYRDNPFLPQSIIDKIEKWQGADSEKWKVYGLGKTGKLEGIIFPNIRYVQEMPEHYSKEAYGMDFGFTNSYTTFTRIVLSEGRLYCQLLLYKKGMDGTDIVKWLDENGISKRITITGDNAAPSTINIIYKAGYYIWPCKKWAGSVKDEISLIKGYGTLNVVDDEEGHVMAEQLEYVWIESKIDGELTTEPVKDPCHFFDGLRYGHQELIRGKAKSAQQA